MLFTTGCYYAILWNRYGLEDWEHGEHLRVFAEIKILAVISLMIHLLTSVACPFHAQSPLPRQGSICWDRDTTLHPSFSDKPRSIPILIILSRLWMLLMLTIGLLTRIATARVWTWWVLTLLGCVQLIRTGILLAVGVGAHGCGGGVGVVAALALLLVLMLGGVGWGVLGLWRVAGLGGGAVAGLGLRGWVLSVRWWLGV